MVSPIIQIDDILVSTEILTERFSCDYERCRGICCIIGDSGAPLTGKEAVILKRQYPKFKDWMSEEGRAKIAQVGFYETDSDGDIVTPLLKNGDECAYTRFEGKNCLCAIERAHANGRCTFVKPISCRLYPIRASKLSNGMTALNLHRWNLCECAFHKGKKENIPVYVFLKEALIAAYGAKFYEKLCKAAQMLSAT